MVYVREGVYNETVTVSTPSLTIRGADRNKTILDGEFELSNGFHVVADAVAIGNFTARNYTVNAFYWTGVTGYRGSYITAYNNGDYGIYAFDSVDGLFEHMYASGNRDSGIYIGGNTVINNNTGDAPTKGFARLAWCEGIIIAGGEGAIVEKNLVVNHDRFGIITNVLPDENIWWASDNLVRNNTIAGTGLGDMGLVGPLSKGNCFEDNLAANGNVPPMLTFYHSCDGINLPFQMDLGTFFYLFGVFADGANNVPAGSDYRLWPPAPNQVNMPDAATATAQPAFDVFIRPDIDAITTPELPAGTEIRGKEITVSGIPITRPTFWTFIFATWAYFLPLAIVGAWIALAIWDMVKRQDEMSKGLMIAWFFVILLIPSLGVMLYFIFGRSAIPGWLRGLVVGGAPRPTSSCLPS